MVKTTILKDGDAGCTIKDSDQPSPNETSIPQPMDIILGRGKKYSKHPGNVIFQGRLEHDLATT